MLNSVWCLTWGVHTPWYVIKAFSLSEFHKKKITDTIPFFIQDTSTEIAVLYNGSLSSFLYPAADKHFSLPPHHIGLSDLSASPFHSHQTLHKYISSTKRKYTLCHQIDAWTPHDKVRATYVRRKTAYTNIPFLKLWKINICAVRSTSPQRKQHQTNGSDHLASGIKLCPTCVLCLNKGRPTRWHLLYYLLLNMFQTLIRPSSGACDYLLRCVGW